MRIARRVHYNGNTWFTHVTASRNWRFTGCYRGSYPDALSVMAYLDVEFIGH